MVCVLHVTIFGGGLRIWPCCHDISFLRLEGNVRETERNRTTSYFAPASGLFDFSERILFYRALEDYRIIDSALPLFTPGAS